MGSFEIARAPQFKYNLTALTSLFNSSSALDAVCPKAVPTAGTPDGFDTERGCCRHARRINRSVTGLRCRAGRWREARRG